ncbi:MAG: MarR family EPS-associated transcriptional regulator [Proteobacteria bacterium]|nr:MarR family EPS-associated transcriptional regulator [Pseudomonadota bacterium]
MGTQLDEKYYLLKELEKSESNSQRALAENMGISLGKINFILKALISKGLVKMENFAYSDNKIGYRYVLTPDGITEKMKITKAFIKRKEEEYARIRQEIEDAKSEIQN